MITESTSNKSGRSKADLEQSSMAHREAFENELSEAVDRAKSIGTSALVIGGGFVVSYYIIKKLTTRKTVKKIKTTKDPDKINEVVIHKQPTVFATVRNVVMTEIAVFLLGIAKQKLVNYIENFNAGEDEHSKGA